MTSLLLGFAMAQEAPPIVGGSAAPGEHEAVGAIVAVYGQQGGQFCSGTLVAKRWVITAGHCIEAAQEYEADGWDIYWVATDDIYDSNWDRYAVVDTLYVHAGYVAGAKKGEINDDIGILHLATSINNWPTYPLNTAYPTNSWVGKSVTYVGYGLTTENGPDQSGVRRKVNVPVYGWDDSYLHTYYGSGSVKAICGGDSGGAALMVFNGEYRLVGANSFGYNKNGGGNNCEDAGQASASTRIDAYYGWITDRIPESELDADTDADADSDTDSDADADSDADSDSDADTDVTDTGLARDSGPAPDRPSGQGLDTDGPLGFGICGTPLVPGLAGLLVAGAAVLRRREQD